MICISTGKQNAKPRWGAGKGGEPDPRAGAPQALCAAAPTLLTWAESSYRSRNEQRHNSICLPQRRPGALLEPNTDTQPGTAERGKPNHAQRCRASPPRFWQWQGEPALPAALLPGRAEKLLSIPGPAHPSGAAPVSADSRRAAALRTRGSSPAAAPRGGRAPGALIVHGTAAPAASPQAAPA